jgi:hypothetical protein
MQATRLLIAYLSVTIGAGISWPYTLLQRPEPITLFCDQVPTSYTSTLLQGYCSFSSRVFKGSGMVVVEIYDVGD